MLLIYDRILGDLIKLKIPFIVATGMSQTTNDTKEFYYRLRDHNNFLKILDISYVNIFTRMSRDFEINFKNNSDRDIAFNKLINLKEEKTQINIFNEIDTRNKSLFVTLTYPIEVKDDSVIIIDDIKIKLSDYFIFVAIKNGKHQAKGFAFFSNAIEKFIPNNNEHVKNIYNSIIRYFSIIE